MEQCETTQQWTPTPQCSKCPVRQTTGSRLATSCECTDGFYNASRVLVRCVREYGVYNVRS